LKKGNENEHAFALEDDCALYITNDSYEIIGEPSKAWAFQVKEGELIKKKG
jgi:dipeptidase E